MEITTKEAAEILHITTRRVIQLAQEGKISGEKRGRDWQIQKESVERYQREQDRQRREGER